MLAVPPEVAEFTQLGPTVGGGGGGGGGGWLGGGWTGGGGSWGPHGPLWAAAVPWPERFAVPWRCAREPGPGMPVIGCCAAPIANGVATSAARTTRARILHSPSSFWAEEGRCALSGYPVLVGISHPQLGTLKVARCDLELCGVYHWSSQLHLLHGVAWYKPVSRLRNALMLPHYRDTNTTSIA